MSMSDTFYRVLLGAIYAFTISATMYMCSDFLTAIRASYISQRRASWAQVYWVRRSQLMAEKDWQEKWEALHSVEYCRQLQEAANVKDPRDTQ